MQFCKATENTNYVDSDFARNWAGIKSAGIAVRGAYHFGAPVVFFFFFFFFATHAWFVY